MRSLLSGACRDEDPELFFPVGTTGKALWQIEAAKRVCQQCDVVEACLDWALRTGQDSGVLGGLTEIQRRALRRRQQAVDQSDIPVSTGNAGGATLDRGWTTPVGRRSRETTKGIVLPGT